MDEYGVQSGCDCLDGRLGWPLSPAHMVSWYCTRILSLIMLGGHRQGFAVTRKEAGFGRADLPQVWYS